jgi:Fe-S-cluster containining protein
MQVSLISLSIHRQYRCQDSGACCTAGWPIPVEADRLAAIEGGLASGRLTGADGRRANVVDRPAGAPADAPGWLAVERRACVFYRPDGARRCEIHRALGHDALPLACRQFPRVSLLDPRGVSVTLSHYCPTAAALLEQETAPVIVADAPAFPADGEYVGLDAREGLPPALRPDMLMDWDAWWLFEKEAVALIARADDPARALAVLGRVVEDVRTWRPEDGDLSNRVRQAFARAARDRPAPPVAQERRLREVIEAVPDELRPDPSPLQPRVPRPAAHVLRNFLAAHAFANWTAHLGEGLRTWLRSIETAFALVALGDGVRQADLLLRHLASPYRLARVWSQVEREG